MPKVNVKRPDGTILSVDEDQAKKLEILGYKRETPDEASNRLAGEHNEDYYTGGLQTLKTIAEGVASGATLGASDVVFDSEDMRGRAKYNPGKRFASELAGAIVPAILAPEAEAADVAAEGATAVKEASTVSKIAGATPAGMLSKGTDALASAVTDSRAGKAVVKGAAEGAAYGAGGELSRESLNNDPISAESLLAGAGWGSLWGIGLSYAGSRLARGAEGVAAEANKAAEAGEKVKLTKGEVAEATIPTESWQAFRNEAKNLADAADNAIETAQNQIEERAQAAEAAGVKSTMAQFVPEVTGLRSAGDQLYGEAFKAGDKQTMRRVSNMWEAVDKAARGEDPEKLQSALNKYRAALEDSAEDLGHIGVTDRAKKILSRKWAADNRDGLLKLDRKSKLWDTLEETFKENGVWTEGAKPSDMLKKLRTKARSAFQLPPVTQMVLESGRQAAEQSIQNLADLRILSEHLSDMPRTPGAWAELPPDRAEVLHAALEKAMSTDIPELAPLRDSLKASASRLSEVGGINAGSPADSLRKTWAAIRAANTRQALEATDKLINGAARESANKGRIRSFMGGLLGHYAAKKAGAKFGADVMSSYGAYAVTKKLVTGGIGGGLVGDVLGMKAAVGTRLRQAVAAMTPGAKALERGGGRFEPLLTKLNGEKDSQPYKTRDELYKRRAQEIREAAPSVNDTLYRAVEPLHMAGEPTFAKTLHATAVAQFQSLLNVLPKDPGTAFSMFKTLHPTDPVQLARFARVYDVFQHGTEAIERAIATGHVTPEVIQAFQSMSPELHNTLKMECLSKIADPEYRSKMKLGDMMVMSRLLGISLHSTQRPEWIVAQQNMFMQRNLPQQESGSSKKGGRPAGPGPSTSTGQQSQEQPTQAQISTNR